MPRRFAQTGDLSTGHPSGPSLFPPSPSYATNLPFVFLDGQPVLSQGDRFVPHTDGTTAHDGAVIQGSTLVFIDGRPAARHGDLVGPVPCAGTVVNTRNTFVFENETGGV